MRKHLLFLVIPAMLACSSREPKQAVLSGRLNNAVGGKLLVITPETIDTLPLSDDGTFTYKVMLSSPIMLKTSYGRLSTIFYLEPGDSSYFELDVNNPDAGIAFSGSRSELNQSIKLRSDALRAIRQNWRGLFSLKPAAFNQKMDSMGGVFYAQIDSFKAKSKSFTEMEANRVRYFLLGLRSYFPLYSAYLEGKQFNLDSADLSLFDSIDLNKGDHLFYDDYANLIETYAQLRFEKIFKADSLEKLPVEERLSKTFAMVDSVFTNSKVREYLKKQRLIEQLQFGEFWKLGDVCNNFLKTSTTPIYGQEVQYILNEKMKLAPGNDAPVFTYNDIKGKTYSLTDFKGKLVYIDFWATWCGPCRTEIPYQCKLERDYQGKKVVFVKISLDDNMDAWRKMVNEKKLGGIHLHAEGAWNSNVAKNYQIKGIPTYLLIDANGKIINPSAPRPSSDEIRKLLDAELAKI